MPDPTLAELIIRNGALFDGMEQEQRGWTRILSGRIDDPDSFDANGGKAGELGYYPLVDVHGVTQYRPCLARLRAIAMSVPPTAYVSRGAAAATAIPAAVAALDVAGWSTAGDGGAAHYRRASVQPDHAGWFRDAAGALWELDTEESRPEFFGYDAATTDDARDAAVEAANFFAYRTGRKLLLRGKKEYLVRVFRLYSGVVTDGGGSVMGSKPDNLQLHGAATIKLANGTNRNGGVVEKAEPKSRGWILRNLNIDGNRENNSFSNTSGGGSGLYLFAANDGIPITGDNDENALIDWCVIRECKGDGIFISGGLGGYNIRQFNIGKLIIRLCEGFGINSQTWTDSSIDTIAISGCGLGAWRSNSWANNHIAGVVKGFYNGWRYGSAGVAARDISQASFRLTDSGRGFWRFEAQEEYVSGFYFGNCYAFQADILADANGFPPGNTGPIAARGAQFHNCDHFQCNFMGDSFHARDATPFLQEQPLALSSSATAGVVPDGIIINATYRNQRSMAIQKSFGTATVGRVTINDNGRLDVYNGSDQEGGIALFNDRLFNRRTYLRSYVDTGDNDLLQIDVQGAGTTGKLVDFFRRVTTTGQRAIRIFRGDGTSTLDHRITAAGSAEFSLFQGARWNVGHLTLGPWHIWADGNGCLRQKSSAPSSALDGSVIGQVLTTAPATATSPGITGQIAFDYDYFYVAVGKDRWCRAPLATW